MNTDAHATIRNILDKTLTGGVSPEEEHALREHLPDCGQCQEYLAVGTRVIAGLRGFSFDVSPDLQAKVLCSLKLRAQQLEAAQPSRRRMVWGCAGALVLLVTGSFLGSQLGNLAAALLNLPPMQVQRLWLVFWVVPSLCLSLLFPLLPLLSNRKEKVL